MNDKTMPAQGPVDVNVSQHCDCDHHETCEVCVPSLYEPKKEMVRLTADGVNRIGDTIAELRMENAQLLAALEAWQRLFPYNGPRLGD